ncbi:hypothetical protein [Haloarchaeobius sp. TZWWS8]|uniref:hypothetical protein n=1 Tax=Haloarchaeobius sp. TZWWS8 TaxID=3446121 RepID=UPI003EBED306
MLSFRTVLIVIAVLLLAAAAGISHLPTASAATATGTSLGGADTTSQSSPSHVHGDYGTADDTLPSVSSPAPQPFALLDGSPPDSVTSVGIVAGGLALTAIVANVQH